MLRTRIRPTIPTPSVIKNPFDIGAMPGAGKYLQSLVNSSSSEVVQTQAFSAGQHVQIFSGMYLPFGQELRHRGSPTSIGARRRLFRVASLCGSMAWFRLHWITSTTTLIQGVLAMTNQTMVVAVTTRYQATTGDQAALLQGLADECLTALTLSDVPVTFTAVWFKLLINFARRCILEHTGGECRQRPSRRLLGRR